MKKHVLVFILGCTTIFTAIASAEQSLAADAAVLTAKPGKWRSERVAVKVRDGTTPERLLDIEFHPTARAGKSDAPDAQAKLFVSTPTTGIPNVPEATSSLGDGSFRDVRLQESKGVRTISFRRALPANHPESAKRARIYDRYWSVSFRYELKDNVLTLKGFPTTEKVNWGVTEFIAPKEDITSIVFGILDA